MGDSRGAMVRRLRPQFRRSAQRRSRFADWWLIWRMPILLLIVMAVWWFGFRPEPQPQEWTEVRHRFALCSEPVASADRAPGCVVDGDTVVIGFGNERRRIRLTGFDTPELEGACEAETALANRARLRLHQWLNSGTFEWSGGADPPRDQYGRELREVRRGADGSDGRKGEYLADTMIESGLASDSGWGAFPAEWCP